MNPYLNVIVCASLFLCACSPKVSTTPPLMWTASTPIMFDMVGTSLKLPHNSQEEICKEILDPNMIRAIAKSCGLSDADLTTFRVAQEPNINWVSVYQMGKSEKAANAMSEQLMNYVRAREEGHSKEFLLSALTNRAALSRISNPDLREIANEKPLIPVLSLQKVNSGTRTNSAGEIKSRTISVTTINGKSVTNETTHIPKNDEVGRWAKYFLVDGEIGWEYYMSFNADGTLEYLREERCDAKEFDPKFQGVIKEVENEVHAEMKEKGSFGEFGSVHTFWHLKKKKLKAKEIDWRSPAELNPNTNYD